MSVVKGIGQFRMEVKGGYYEELHEIMNRAAWADEALDMQGEQMIHIKALLMAMKSTVEDLRMIEDHYYYDIHSRNCAPCKSKTS